LFDARVPTIVSDVGRLELPASVARLPPGSDAGQLAALIARCWLIRIAAHAAPRNRVGRQRGFDRAAQDLLNLVVGPRRQASRASSAAFGPS